MAERRMFAKTIIDSDAFLDMPLSTQSLYFHLGMRADDDGFLNNAKKIQRTIGANDDDYKILVSKNFIIQFSDGVCVVKHWLMHNYIQKDRYKKTPYIEHKDKLSIKNNSVYTLDTECIQVVDSLDTQVRLGKVRLGKDSLVDVNIDYVEEKSSPKKYGTSLPKDWVLPKSWGEWALQEKKELSKDDIRKIAENFKDYWLANANQAKSKKADWEATWRNWVRNIKSSYSNVKPMKGLGVISDDEFKNWLGDGDAGSGQKAILDNG